MILIDSSALKPYTRTRKADSESRSYAFVHTCTYMYLTIIIRRKEAINLKEGETSEELKERHLGGAGERKWGDKMISFHFNSVLKTLRLYPCKFIVPTKWIIMRLNILTMKTTPTVPGFTGGVMEMTAQPWLTLKPTTLNTDVHISENLMLMFLKYSRDVYSEWHLKKNKNHC